MLRKFSPLAGEDKTISWWWVGIKVGVVTTLIILWWLDQKNKKHHQIASEKSIRSQDQSIPLPDEDLQPTEQPQKQSPEALKPDDLRKIEGIGPKFQATLQSAGIQTYVQLAAAKAEDLKQILNEAGIRSGDPTTWPEQAALAAAGDWEKLKALQSTLKGGRRE